MDKERFTKDASGAVKRFHNELTGKPDWQFIPAELPVDWDFPTRLWPLLADAKEALGTLNGIGRTLLDPDLLIRPQQTREAIQSSKIEGTVVAPQQLLLYELDPREPSSAEGRVADWREVFNYTTALRTGCEMLKTLPICNRIIKSMHQELMRGIRGARKFPGEFRPMQVQIGSSGRYVPPGAGEIERLMGNLETYLNLDEYTYDPLVMCFITHYQFEAIHPFADGNGRVGRCLLALLIYLKLGHYLPWLYLSPYFEQYDDEYANNLFRVSTHGDWEQWVEFCLNGTIRQAKDSIVRCEKLNGLLTNFYTRLSAPTPRTETIIRQLFKNPIVNVPEVRKICGDTAHNTAQRDIDRLVEAGILSLLGTRRPRSYYAREIWEIAYSDMSDVGIADGDDDSDES
jgi:Fic family protein